MKTWEADDPKAALMLRKRVLIVNAAREAFLAGGYAGTAMDAIAALAGVSIKTVYRHFDDKDDLFLAVMQAACSPAAGAERTWPHKAPRVGLRLAAVEYLRHALSEEQIALYRVVVRDAGRFPQLGKRYAEAVTEGRNALFAAYLKQWGPVEGWKVRSAVRAAEAFAGLLRAGWFESVVLGLAEVEEAALLQHAKTAAAQMLVLLAAGVF